MKIRTLQQFAAAVACIGLLAPQAVFAAPGTDAGKGVAGDVALRNGGVFVGQVVDAQGQPMVKSDVSVRYAGKEVAQTTTDKNGVFAAKGLKGGQHEVVAGGGRVAFRLWAPTTAPPAASQAALIVTGDEVVNGQYGGQGGVLGWMRERPLLVAAAVVTAIAVPLAIADDDDPSS